ncbi:MAG: SHOCT domain-containing protein [Epsilonproteobacteria bacterium]|nr:SHOCT domain-containing protein [Campylobacterota bacterium]
MFGEFSMEGWGFGMGLMWLIPILFIIALVYFLRDKDEEEWLSVNDILNIRFANGEIDEEEYKRKKKIIKLQEM